MVSGHRTNDHANGKTNLEVGAALPSPMVRPSAPSIASAELSSASKIRQGSQMWIGHGDDTAAVTAVTPVWSAARDELLSAETDRPISAVSSLCLDYRFVKKHRAA